MRRIAVVLFTLSVFVSLCYAQEDPIPPKRSKAGKIGGLFGYTPGWLFVDVKPINDMIVANKGASLKSNGVYLNGIGGAAYIMFVNNLRVGGLGMSGKSSSTSLDGFGVRRDVEMNVGFGGVTGEYVVQLVERCDVAFGAMLGGGGIDLTLRQSNGSSLSWNGEWGTFGGNSPGQVINVTKKLSGTYFVVVPQINVEYALVGWLGVRLGASYVVMFAPSWEVDDKYDLLGVPSKVNGNGFLINAGLFVGTF